jgi:hypothetical protein
VTWSGHSQWSHKIGSRDSKLVRLAGDYAVPSRVEWKLTGTTGDPNLHAVFEVRDGRPECVEISIKAADKGRGLRTSDLEALQVDRMTVQGFTRFAMLAKYDPETNVTTSVPVTDERELWDALAKVEDSVKAPRRGVTRAELEQVAKIYRDNIDSSPTNAVQTLMGYGSHRTAARRVQQAEGAGLLPNTTKGKRRS